MSFATARLHCFGRVDSDTMDGVMWISRFYPYDKYPIFFQGHTREEVIQKANQWRDEQLAHAQKMKEVRKVNVVKAQAGRRKKT